VLHVVIRESVVTSFAKKNIVVGMTEIIGRLPLLLTVGLLARSVGPEVYGSWAVILVYQALVAAITCLGLDSSLSRLATVADPAFARAYLALAIRTCAVALLPAAVFTVVLGSFLIPLLGVPEVMRHLLSASILLAALTTAEGLLSAYFKAREDARRYAAFVFVRSSVDIIAVLIVFVLAPPTEAVSQLWHYIFLVFGLKAVGYAVLGLVGAPPSAHVPAKQQHEFLRYGLPMIPAVLLSWFALQGDRLLLAHLTDAAALGVYAFGASLASYLVYVGYAVYPLMLTRSCQLYDAGNLVALKQLFSSYQIVMLAAYVAALGLIVPFARDGVVWLAGHEFESAAPMVVVLGVAVCVDRVFGVYQYIFYLVRRPSWILWLSLLNATLMALAIVAAVELSGIKAVPLAMLNTTVLYNGIRLAVTRWYLALPFPTGSVLGLAATIGVCWSATLGVWDWSLVARATVSCAAFVTSLALLNGAFHGQLMEAIQSIKRRAGFAS
jgi:O-antigen/teichoic acid export membrane protein